MARVNFTSHLQRHVECPAIDVEGTTVREVLDAVVEQYPQARSYLMDEHGCLHRHVAVFLDGAPVLDRAGLTDAVTSASEIYIMQALSGG